MAASKSVPLWGGALTCSLPEDAGDISAIREVPDHQEVWVLPGDQSVIFELLERQDVSDSDAPSFFWDDLMDTNDTAKEDGEITLQEVAPRSVAPQLYTGDTPDTQVILVTGTQKIAKFKEDVKNIVAIFMAIIRIPKVDTDLLLTWNAPVQVAAASSSAAAFIEEAHEDSDLAYSTAKAGFVQAVKSLTIHDWSLFGGADA